MDSVCQSSGIVKHSFVCTTNNKWHSRLNCSLEMRWFFRCSFASFSFKNVTDCSGKREGEQEKEVKQKNDDSQRSKTLCELCHSLLLLFSSNCFSLLLYSSLSPSSCTFSSFGSFLLSQICACSREQYTLL